MLTFHYEYGGPPVNVKAVVGGVPVYLDTFSLINLAKHDQSRRRRFINALHGGADLIFSITNAAELSGFQERSADMLRAFLDEVGLHWFPVELDPQKVIDKEANGETNASASIASDFLSRYAKDRSKDCIPGSGKIINFETLFKLGGVLDWFAPERDSIIQKSGDLDAALMNMIQRHREQYEVDPAWLDRRFPPRPFDDRLPYFSVYLNLVRLLILESKTFRLVKNDGLDFCHAIMGAAYGSFATLDKHWKRRIEALPKPSNVARIYYAEELDSLVSDVEAAVEWLNRRNQ